MINLSGDLAVADVAGGPAIHNKASVRFPKVKPPPQRYTFIKVHLCVGNPSPSRPPLLVKNTGPRAQSFSLVFIISDVKRPVKCTMTYLAPCPPPPPSSGPECGAVPGRPWVTQVSAPLTRGAAPGGNSTHLLEENLLLCIHLHVETLILGSVNLIRTVCAEPVCSFLFAILCKRERPEYLVAEYQLMFPA